MAGIPGTLHELATELVQEFQRQGLLGGSSASTRQDQRETESRQTTDSIKGLKDEISVRRAGVKRSKEAAKVAEKASRADVASSTKALAAQKARMVSDNLVQRHDEKISQKRSKIARLRIEEDKRAIESSKERRAAWGKNLIKAGIAGFGTALGKSVNDFRAQMEFGTQGVGIFGQMTQALALGVDPALLSELQAQNKAAVIAMGGIENWAGGMADIQKGLYTYIGDLDKTTAFMATSFQTMRLAGIEPTTEALNATSKSGDNLAKSYIDIQKMGGQTFEQLGEMMRGFVESEAVRFKLAGTMDKQRRMSIVQEIAERQKMILGLGMTADQAKRAGEALDTLGAKGPMDRFKKAAKLQAVAGAMGLGAQGSEGAEIMRLGSREGGMNTAEGGARLAEIFGVMQQKVAASQTGLYGQEFMLRGLVDKTELGGEIGVESAFVTALGKDFGPLQKANAVDNKTTAEENVTQTGYMYEGTRLLKAIKDNPLGVASLAALSTISGTALLISTGVMAIAGKVGMGSLAGQGWKQTARSGLKGAAGTGAGVLGAAYVGYQAGTMINDQLMESFPGAMESLSDGIGWLTDKALFFTDASKERSAQNETETTAELELAKEERAERRAAHAIQQELLKEQKQANQTLKKTEQNTDKTANSTEQLKTNMKKATGKNMILIRASSQNN